MGSSNSTISDASKTIGHIGREYAIQVPHKLHKCIGFIGLPNTGKTRLISILSGNNASQGSTPCTSINLDVYIIFYEIAYAKITKEHGSFEDRLKFYREFFKAYGLHHLKFLFIIVQELFEQDILIMKVAQENNIPFALISTKFEEFPQKHLSQSAKNLVYGIILHETRRIREKLSKYSQNLEPTSDRNQSLKIFFISLKKVDELLQSYQQDCDLLANEISLVEFFRNVLEIDLYDIRQKSQKVGFKTSKVDLYGVCESPKMSHKARAPKTDQYGTFLAARVLDAPSKMCEKSDIDLVEDANNHENMGIHKNSLEVSSLCIEDLSKNLNIDKDSNMKFVFIPEKSCQLARRVEDNVNFSSVSKQVY